MRTFAAILGCACLAWSNAVGDDSLRGGLIGAAIGAIVGHNSSDIDTEVAVPAFAAAGALLGSQYDSDWFSSSCDYDDWRYRRSYHPHHRYGYHRGYHDPYYRYPRHHVRRFARKLKRVAKAPKQKREVVAQPENLHPGITFTLVRVPMTNGTSIEFRILNVKGRYVGPKGETYDAMPTAAEVEAKLPSGA